MALKKHIALGLAGALSISLVLSGMPAVSLAVTSEEIQAELNSVQAHLQDLYDQTEQVSEELNDTRHNLDVTNQSIAENEALAEQKAQELNDAKAVLAQVIAEDYKSGGVSLMSVLLGSNTIEDFVSNIYYANKASENRREVIETVKGIQTELDKTRASLNAEREEQVKLVAQNEKLQADLEANIQETEGYVNSLSDQMREAVAAEEAARQEALRQEALAAQAAAEEAARQEAEQAQQNQQETPQVDAGRRNNNNNNNNQNQNKNNNGNNNGGNNNGSGGQIPAGIANTIISAAASQLGVPYEYGACSPGVAFDCSGLVMYAYGCAGYSVPHSSGALAGYCNKPISQAVPGDIVWRSGHVGIYVGGGSVIEAFHPGRGVGYGTVSEFVAAGSPAAL